MTPDQTADRKFQSDLNEYDRRTTLTTEAEDQLKRFEEEAHEKVMNSEDRGMWLKDALENMNISDSHWNELFDGYIFPEPKYPNILCFDLDILGFLLDKIIRPVLEAKLKKEMEIETDLAQQHYEDQVRGDEYGNL